LLVFVAVAAAVAAAAADADSVTGIDHLSATVVAQPISRMNSAFFPREPTSSR